MVPGVDDHEKLACEVQASFCLPRRVSKLCKVKNNHQAPPALPCLCRKKLLAATRFHPCFPGHLGDTAGEDSSICPHPSVLGGEG